MYLSFNSKVMTASQITDYLTRVVQPRLQTINGVANAQILGGQTFAMRIWLNPDKMAALGVTPLDVRNALAANNFTTAAGQVKGDFVQTTINAETSLDNPAEFGKLVVVTRGDALVRLDDIATIELGAESADSSSVFDGLKAVFIGIFATPTSNPLTVIGDVRKAFPDIQRQLPAGMEAAIAYDATKFINASIKEVQKTLLEAALIVIVVIFLFLGNLRSTLIPIVTIPLSLIGVMFALLALGYSINLLTLLALVLAIGLVVDDAIVVVENIHRHIEEGMQPFEAALDGRARDRRAGHLHDDHAGRRLCAHRLRLGPDRRAVSRVRLHAGRRRRRFGHHRPDAVADDGLQAAASADQSTRPFRPLPRPHVRRPAPPLRAPAAPHAQLSPGHAADPGRRHGWRPASCTRPAQKELAPEEDQGILFNIVKAPQTANLDYLEQATGELNKVFETVPEKEHVFIINGMGNNVHQAIAGILFKPWEERERTQKEILQSLQPKVARHRRRRRRSPFRCRRCRARPAAGRRCSSWSRRRPTTRSWRRCWPRCRPRRKRAASSSSPTRT